jgi:hypothetical protein
VRVVGSKLTGYAMDESSQMPEELKVSFWTQQMLLRLDRTRMEFSSTTLQALQANRLTPVKRFLYLKNWFWFFLTNIELIYSFTTFF